MPELKKEFKRETANKLKVGDILTGNPIIDLSENEGKKIEKFVFLELFNKQIKRVNVVANIIEKYQSEGEKTFGSLTIDDASGQIRLKVFGEDTKKFEELEQGDTIIVIGLLRSYNQELYILPEIIKKIDPQYLLIRKLELEKSQPKTQTVNEKQEAKSLKEEIMSIIKKGEETGGADIETIILTLKTAKPEVINKEIKNLIEEGIAYEPRPGKVRYLG